jgi:hypothetical protein
MCKISWDKPIKDIDEFRRCLDENKNSRDDATRISN